VARNAVLASKLPESVPGTSIDRQCGSSQQALQFAAQAVMSGTMDIVIAAGVESMSRVPMGMPSSLPAKNGMGSYISQAIHDRYPGPDFSQFLGAEMMVKKYGLTKDQLDEYAFSSHQRAIAATKSGAFADEIIPLAVRMADGTVTTEMHTIDEGIRFDASLAGISAVKILQEGGAITAANASQICDGSAGLLVVNERGLKTLGLTPLARFVSFSVRGVPPEIMGIGPKEAIPAALKTAGLKQDDIGWIELNEAFAAQSLAVIRDLGLDAARVNPMGGAIALGHPLGATGAIRAATVVHALRRRNLKYGMVTMCVGTGMGAAGILERM
jgi:acetyl-CoA C-acetyltransferase